MTVAVLVQLYTLDQLLVKGMFIMAQVCSGTWHVVLSVHGHQKVLHTVCEQIRIAPMITVLSVTRREFKDGMNENNLIVPQD